MDYQKAFEEVDVILTPSSNRANPPSIDEKMSHIESYSNDVMTVSPSLAGLPAISIPHEKESTIGIQMIGPHLQDGKLLTISKFAEKK